MNLLDLFDPSLRDRAADAGLEWNGRTYTFGEIEARSNRMAHALRARGFRKGDRLCVHLANRIELIDLFLACVKLGVIFVPINILYRQREIAHITGDAAPRLLLTESELFDVSEQPSERPAESLDAATPAAIIYTSGTTGASKGAVLTHGNFAANGRNLIEAWRFTSDDRLLLALPLFHIHALGNGLHCWLGSGCRMRLLERFDHRTAAGEFLDFRPTVFFGVPTMYVRLLDAPPEIARSVRLFVSGSAPLPPNVFEEFRQRFGQAILERYGMTEAFMIAGNPYDGERRAGTVGFPFSGVEVRVVDGELQVRSDTLFAGYWRREPFEGGWFKTGDLASIDAEGRIALLGRRSELIISGGFNIYPREIEELLLEQPGVKEAAVIGIPDELRGEVPVAFYAGDADAEALACACRNQLASFKVPRKFTRVDALPRTALGKVQKHLLQ